MKVKRIISLVAGVISMALSSVTWAAGHGGGGGGFSGVVSGGGSHPNGGGGGHVGSAGGFHPAGFARPSYYYSRGMHYPQARPDQLRAPVRQSPSFAGTNRGINNLPARQGINNSAARQLRTPAQRPAFNAIVGHVAERHQGNWHGDWDRHHAHFDHHRFFVFIDGFWCGLDDGFFPWDYYPYYAYDYYPYDYYPGYYADVEPYYYNGNVYSNEPMRDPTVSTVQTELSQLGYYSGPVDGIFGPTTRDAVAKYQIDRNLNVSGSLSPDTLKSFGLPQPAAS